MAEPTGDTPAAAGTPQNVPANAPAVPAADPVATPPATPPANPKSTPAAGDPPAGDPPAGDPPAGDEPPVGGNNWAGLRTKFANGDEKLEKRLARYSSVESALEALVAAQDKIAKGEHKAPLSEDPTPEELTAYRAANGIPETPDKYEIKLADDLVVGEADKPLVDGFLKEAHALNMKPGEVNKMLSWYFAEQDKAADDIALLDNEARETAENELREAWGGEFKLNKNLIIGMLDQAPKGVKDQILGARAPDGTPLASHGPTLRWLSDLARTINPVATVVPGSGTNAMQTIETEIGNLEKMMGDHSSDYWKGPHAVKNQERYRQLVDAKSRMQR